MNGSPPELTVVIPFYNRASTIQYTLASVARARGSLSIEVILVDDGSSPLASSQLQDTPLKPDRYLRQENRGLLFARLEGLKAASGTNVLFLDSDDLVGPDKFSAQLSRMREAKADVTYSDSASAALNGAPEAVPRSTNVTREEVTTDLATFFIRVQPAPHNPIFRTEWLREVVAAAAFPPHALYNPVAEIWFYHIAALRQGVVQKVEGVHTISGQHSGARITGLWEKMAVASLGVMEAFERTCPPTPETRSARLLFGVKAFASWRKLPFDFFPEFDVRLLNLWKRAPRGSLSDLGGRNFGILARLFGPAPAARLLRRIQGNPYSTSRQLGDPTEFFKWMNLLPPCEHTHIAENAT